MLITLTTDFGSDDSYVGIMKGVIYGINPQATVVDLTHGIPPQDIVAGALTLRHSIPYFPAGTIHVAVVDPGVGSARRPVLIEAGGNFFIGPDNGIWSLALAEVAMVRAIHLSNSEFHRKPTSATFHGRDIFAPVGAHLSLGLPVEKLGEPIDALVRLEIPAVERHADHLSGAVIYVDRFGNLFTNIREHDLKGLPTDGLTVNLGAVSIRGIKESYASAADVTLTTVINSWGCLEIAAYKDSAQRIIGGKVGDKVDVFFDRSSGGH